MTADRVRGPRFAGYAAVFGVVDRAGDIARAGAFAGAGVVPLLWQHAGAPVGEVRVMEDARGLLVEGRVDDPALGALVRGGAVAGCLSGIGRSSCGRARGASCCGLTCAR